MDMSKVMNYLHRSVRLSAYCLFLVGVVLAQSPAIAEPRPLDRIVAVVNDDVITRGELDQRMDLVIRQLAQRGSPPPRSAIERQVLDRMIMDQVQLQMARQTGLRVDDTQLERALQRIAQENKLSIADFRAAVERDGVKFARFREDIRNEIIISRLREREVDNRIVITDQEIDNLLASPARPKLDTEYDIAHILVRVPDQATPEQIKERRARAEQAQRALSAANAEINQVAASFSDAPDALNGGRLGFRTLAQLPGIFAEPLASMETGAVSPILRSPNGFHIFKLIEKRGKTGPQLEAQTHARHILIKTNELVSENDARARLTQLKERIENGGDFAQLARLHSDDSSASRGGDLGWLSPGDTVPEFENALNSLKINQVSDPVQSPFGWHLIQVLERRSQDVSQEREKLTARRELRARKAEEAYQEWLRQLRDRAYVEIRLDS